MISASAALIPGRYHAIDVGATCSALSADRTFSRRLHNLSVRPLVSHEREACIVDSGATTSLDIAVYTTLYIADGAAAAGLCLI